MQKGKYFLIAGVALAVVLSAYLLSLGIRHFSGGDPVVRVTGMAERHITSDLAVLSITFNKQSLSQTDAYRALEEDKKLLMNYLTKAGFKANEVTEDGVTILQGIGSNAKEYYSDRAFDGYRLTNSLRISSSRVEQVELLNSSISQLIGEGVEVTTNGIAYYYTKLNDLKVELLKEASKDAHARATIIAEGGQASLGKLKNASMGVFQIVGRNQAEEEYSWGGTLNTTSKEKTATVTVKANYILK